MDCSTEFLQNYFLNLPWTVLYEILRLLPAELVYDPLSKVPSLRSLIVEHYYSKELHFILSPTLRPHFCTPDEQKRELIDIFSYGEIEDFLLDNPDIAPEIVRVITSQDFRSMELLLTEYRTFFQKVPKFQIQIEKYELSESDMEFLLSFPNLHKLQTGRIKLRKASPAMSSGFQHMQNFKEIVFLGHELSDWSKITLPPNLENLDVSWYADTDVTYINLPDSVINLYWNQVGLHNGVFDKMSFSPTLRTLMLTYNSLHYIDVSQLPQSLETIDLSNNNLSRFKFDEANPRWPINLRSILLNNNLIDDGTLKDLACIEWPPFLENLRLDMNRFTRLESLLKLPENLKYLDLSDTLLSGFQVTNNEDDYLYFRFPDSLETLNIQGSRALTYPQKSSTVVPPENRIMFPANLETLNLAECNIDDLSYFLFPSSLKTLSLSGNLITTLTSYLYSMDGNILVDWKQLENLKELELFFNRIDNLENWMPPISIRKIDLRRNLIKVLTLDNTPIFNKIFCAELVDLRLLNFEQNQIHEIDSQLELPPNLTDLNLSRNSLTKFTFTSMFLTHSNLSSIDLSWNKIEEIFTISPSGDQDPSNLRELDLSKNSGAFHMTLDEFYNTLEQVGLQVTKKKHNIKSKHLFK